MSEEQSTTLGKKVFFLYPTASVQNQIITELAQQEYEVYVARDHARLARALKKYANSLLFINIDEGMPESEWQKWINTLASSQPELKIGIFSASADDALQDKYEKNPHITCGFIHLKLDMSRSVNLIVDVLKEKDVKGRRKYLRASTEHEKTATINMPMHSDFINGVIKDISVVGISCTFPHDPGLKKNSLYKDIQIRLQTMLLKVEAVVFGSRPDAGDNIYVLLFTQRIDPDIRVKIRKYIQQNLQNKMDGEIN